MAMYNPNFPQTYNPYGQSWNSSMNQQPLYSQPQQQQRQNNGITWVQGENAAKSYLVAPNETAQLWDSEAQTIYLKSADASGMPSMRILDYTFRDMSGQQNYSTATMPKVVDGQAKEVEYATKSDLDALTAQINNLTMAINNMTQQNQNSNYNNKQKKGREDYENGK